MVQARTTGLRPPRGLLSPVLRSPPLPDRTPDAEPRPGPEPKTIPADVLPQDDFSRVGRPNPGKGVWIAVGYQRPTGWGPVCPEDLPALTSSVPVGTSGRRAPLCPRPSCGDPVSSSGVVLLCSSLSAKRLCDIGVRPRHTLRVVGPDDSTGLPSFTRHRPVHLSFSYPLSSVGPSSRTPSSRTVGSLWGPVPTTHPCCPV